MLRTIVNSCLSSYPVIIIIIIIIIIIVIIQQSVLKQVQRLFQSKFSKECDLMFYFQFPVFSHFPIVIQ